MQDLPLGFGLQGHMIDLEAFGQQMTQSRQERGPFLQRVEVDVGG